MQVNLQLATDSDGFLSQECPHCLRIFKVVFGEGSPDAVSFCPYCGRHGTDCWWTSSQVKYIEETAVRALQGDITDALKKAASGSKSIKVTGGSFKGSAPIPPEETLDHMPIHEFGCCGERVKHDGQNERVFCVICGSENVVAAP